MTKLIKTIPQLPARKPDAHKGDCGKVLIIGGSQAMAGAPALAGLAALRSGAGLVRIAIAQAIQPTVAQLVPCATTLALPQDKTGRISRNALAELLHACEDNDSIVLGPGLNQSSDLIAIVESIIKQTSKPLLIDADGLNNLSSLASQGLQLNDMTVLTPHPGEMQRLWQAWFRETLPTNRQTQAEKLSRRSGAVVVLKGHATVVTDGNQTYINDTGNPGLATGGTGDVLSGCIGALLALGGKNKTLKPLNAAILGVWSHGKAADLATKKCGQLALIATDLPEIIGKVLSDVCED